MINGDQHGMRHSYISPFVLSSGTDLLELRIEKKEFLFFTVEWVQMTSVECDRALPFLVLPQRRLPAPSLLLGLSPA